MALRKFCNTLEDSGEIVCGSMCVLDLSIKIKRFIEFERVCAGKTQFDDAWSASPNRCCLICTRQPVARECRQRRVLWDAEQALGKGGQKKKKHNEQKTSKRWGKKFQRKKEQTKA